MKKNASIVKVRFAKIPCWRLYDGKVLKNEIGRVKVENSEIVRDIALRCRYEYCGMSFEFVDLTTGEDVDEIDSGIAIRDEPRIVLSCCSQTEA